MNSIASKITSTAAVSLILVATLSSGPASAGDDKKSTIKSVTAHSGQAPSNTPTSDLPWVETPIGPMASPVSGDFTQGAPITYLKFPPGAKTPLHTHSADYVGIVLSGNARHTVKGIPETERILPPGSHWFMPANVEHVSECVPGAECVMALIQGEKFDFLEISKKK